MKFKLFNFRTNRIDTKFDSIKPFINSSYVEKILLVNVDENCDVGTNMVERLVHEINYQGSTYGQSYVNTTFATLSRQ